MPEIPAALPEPPPPLVPPVLSSETPAGGAAQSGPPTVRLRPRISIKPSNPEPSVEAVSLAGFPPVGEGASSVAIGASATPEEKVEIDLKPFAEPLDVELPPGSNPPIRFPGEERTETGIKIKLKPALSGDSPAQPVLPEPTEFKSPELPAFLSAAPAPSLPGLAPGRVMPALAAAPTARIVPAPPKPKRGVLLPVFVGLLVICAGVFGWLVFRHPNAAPVAAPAAKTPLISAGAPSSAPQASLSRSGEVPPAVATHPTAPVSVAPAPATPSAQGTPTVAPAPVPIVTPPAILANPRPTPPVPPEPSPQFRTYVERLKIAGVRVGPPARLFVDGATVRSGDTIDQGLGVVFVGVDTATNELIFKDATGAVVRRHR